MTGGGAELDRRCIDTIRTLCIDAIEAANSGHPGSTKDPKAPDTLYVHCLGAPFTVNTIPEGTLLAFFEHGHAGKPITADGGESEAMLAQFTQEGVDIGALAAKLQADAAKGFVEAWSDLMSHIDEQNASLRA